MGNQLQTRKQALRSTVPLYDQHVLWSFGTGNVGFGDGELAGPHTAVENPLNPDEIVVSEQFGCDVLIISRSTGEARVLRGERGVAGSGNLQEATHSAYFLTSGPYCGHVLVSEWLGDHRVMILHRDSGEILWCCDMTEGPREAIYWDDEHIMVSDIARGIYKIRLEDQEVVWHYDTDPHGNPFYLQRLFDFNDSYGGDLLAGFWGGNRGIQEIDTVSSEVKWSYGDAGDQGNVEKGTGGDLYDRRGCPVRALRYGSNEQGGGMTIIVDERARIFCVNQDKELIWDLGGSSAEHLYNAAGNMVLPTYIHITRRGTFLVTDWGRNMIYEMNPFCIPERQQKAGYLFRECDTADKFVEGTTMESRGYREKNLQIYNKHSSAALCWRLLGSHNANDWQNVHEEYRLDAGEGTHLLVGGAWNFLKVEARSAEPGAPASITAFLNMQR